MMGYIAVNVSELSIIRAASFDGMKKLMMKVVAGYGSDQQQFMRDVAAWAKDSVLNSGSYGGAQSGDGWVCGPYELVVPVLRCDFEILAHDIESFDEWDESRLDAAVAIAAVSNEE